MKLHQTSVPFQKNRNFRNLLFIPWLGLTLALPVQAAGWVMNVDITTDELSGPGAGCSLREAIQNFQDNALTYSECGGTVGSPVTINVPAGTYSLSGAYIGIGRTDSLTIQGAGAGSTILDRASAPGVRGFQLYGGVNLTLNDLTLTNGSDYGAGGGAILSTSTGTITLNNCLFSNNQTTSGASGGAIYLNGGSLVVTGSSFANNTSSNVGGVIFVNSGTLTVDNSTFTNNQSVGAGGAIYLSSGTTMTINTSTFTGNRASYTGGGGDGGAIVNDQGTLTINDSTFTNNQTTISVGGQNGGALVVGGATNTTINRSTFTGNSATQGGAIFVRPYGSTLSFSLLNTTITGNTAGDASTTGVSNGGGIYFWSNGSISATLKNVTVANNSISGSGGAGLYEASFGGTLTLSLYNSIFANNTGGPNSDCYLSTGTLAVNTNNLVMSGNCGTPAVSTDPLLGTLASNGGTTQTLALSAGSPALDAGDDASCVSPAQNGLTRPQGIHCDIGAYELIAYTFSTAVAGTGSGNVTGSTPAGNYSSGTPITLVATATGDSTFAGWTPAGCTNGFALTANTVCTATFNPPYYNLTLITDGTGSGSVSGAGRYLAGSTLTLEAVPNPGSTFTGWSGGCSDVMTLNSDMTCTATFLGILPPLTLQISLVGNGQGEVTGGVANDPAGLNCVAGGAPCSYTVSGPQWVYPTVTAATGSEFVGWSGDPACTNDGPGKLFLLEDTSCTATFALKNYTLTVERNVPGITITGDGLNCQDTPDGFHNLEGLENSTLCQASYPYGTTVKFTASPAPLEWEWVGWGGACDEQGQVLITNDRMCRAQYREDPNIPNGIDGNGDGLNDAHQPNVMSLADKVAGSYITLVVNPDCVVADGSTVTAETLGKVDRNHPMPQGLIAFELQCSQTPVTLYFHGFQKLLRNLEFRKYGPMVPGDPNTAGWYKLPNVTFNVVTVGGNPVVTASYALVDGQLGDNTGVDGKIVDPAGLGLK